MNTNLNKQKYPIDISTSTKALQLPLPIYSLALKELGIYGQSFSSATNQILQGCSGTWNKDSTKTCCNYKK